MGIFDEEEKKLVLSLALRRRQRPSIVKSPARLRKT
jgi:hypothetical protein